MHSSKMRTARLLTVSQHALLGGVPAPGGGVLTRSVYLPGVYLPGGYLPWWGCVPAQGVCTWPGGGVPAQEGTCPGTHPPCEQNDRQV